MEKWRLLAPGPTPVPQDVLNEMALPIIHHRAPNYKAIFKKVAEDLKYVFQTENDVIVFASSGTGAMEASVANCFCKNDKVLVIRGGKFGERWGEISEAYGLNPVYIDVKWGTAVKVDDVEDALKSNPDIKGILVQASETSTGVKHPIKEIAELVKNNDNCLMIVDGITGVGVFNIETDNWGIDIVVSGSQKAFMLPPGLAFASVSEKAWSFMEKSNLPKYYFDFKKERKNLKKNQNAYTPAVSLIIGLSKVLDMIKDEGLENVFKRHALLAKATREAVKALGLKLFAPDSPSESVTAVLAPEGIDGQDIVKSYREDHKITIAGGQGEAKGKIFRLSHLGFYDKFDIIIAISGLELALKKLGYNFEMGKGVGKALEIFSS
jgi:aspartate aminotransferase-like enzyme